MKKIIGVVILLLLTVALMGGAYAYTRYHGVHPVACTLEAKICPDGSTVARAGPNCEFAACPAPPAPLPDKITAIAKINENAAGLGIIITPIFVNEDSRCPLGVECIQAGTVRLSLHIVSSLGEADATFALGQPVPLEQGIVTLVNVDPPKTTSTTIKPEDYQFTFEFTQRKIPTK